MLCSKYMKKESDVSKKVIICILSVLFLGLFYKSYACLPVPKQAVKTSTHGYGVWSNSFYKSFIPGDERFCVPNDWKPVGEKALDRGGATFPNEGTGILVKSSDFSATKIPLDKTDFELTAVYLATMPEDELQEYVKIIQRAFNDVGSLYPKNDSLETQKHTVLISVGIAGDGYEFENSIYPNPSQFLSVFAKNISHPRAEDLFIHAATHAYNRFHPSFQTYQDNQTPLPAGDFEEMEATWAEISFRSSNEELAIRVENLYRTYMAVMMSTPSNDLLYPLNEDRVFKQISNKSVVVEMDATEGEAEFGHYVLAPLVMLAIEGMLQEQQSLMTLDALLLETHASGSNFFEHLNKYVPKENVDRILRFIEGQEEIPIELVYTGLKKQ